MASPKTRGALWSVVRACYCALAAALLLPAQDDLRDVVNLTNGQVVRGRVYERFDPTELVVLQGGKRVRVPMAKVASLDTVRDRATQLFRRWDALPDNQRYQWYLIEWAQQQELTNLARLLAMDLVLRDPIHEAAHTLLGHRLRGNEWLWPLDGQWVTLADIEAFHADWGHPWVLEGEHFTVRSNGGLRRTVDAALDLERLYVWWFTMFGESLRLHEVVANKMPVHIWAERSAFSAWSSTRQPYFRPRVETPAEASTSFTFFDTLTTPRATRLFEVATQHLLYRTLAEDPAMSSAKERYCGWGEVGFGQFVEQQLTGPAGRAQPQAWQMPIEAGETLVAQRSFGLENLIHRSSRQYYITVADNTAWEWAAAHLFVAYLLDADRRPDLRKAFLQYLVEALRGAKGDSSSSLDRLLGRKVETLEAPWRLWVSEELAAAKLTR
jgi:hypothetical protein